MSRRQFCALGLTLLASGARADEARDPGPRPGDAAPQPLGLGPDGELLTVEQFRGKVLVVSFWASWCGPCLKELPILDNVQRKLGDKVAVVAVNIEERDVFRRLKRVLGDKLALTLSHDARGSVFPTWGKGGIPYLLILNPEGRIHSRYRGYGESTLTDIVADLNELLAKPA
jgi:thiol-disulfide isomerase/thioredoxin